MAMIPIPEELLEQVERGNALLFIGERIVRDAHGNIAIDWLAELRDAMGAVADVRGRGPAA